MLVKEKDSLISIITPIKDGSDLFKTTYDSVISQDHKLFEWIIIDDGSSEEEFLKIRSIVKDPRVKIIKSNDKSGPGKARNVGLKLIKGYYVSFIDSDDLWDRNFLSSSLSFLKSSNSDFVFSGYRRLILETNNYLTDFYPRKKVNSTNILKGSDISCLTALFKRELLDEDIVFGDIPSRNDLIFFYNLTTRTTAQPLNKILATYRIRSKSVSSNKFKALKYQFFVNRKIAKNNFIFSLYNLIRWSLYGYLKYKN